jgi:Flp pilus assembly protein TadD
MESAEPLEEVMPFTSMSELESDSELPALESEGWNSGGEAQVMSTYSEAGYSAKDAAAEKAQVQPKADGQTVGSLAAGLLSSGPLPELEGFEHLREMVTQHPDDLGAQMALAAAYAQRGDVATELRVYRRVLRKSNVSANLMNVINEELADCEEEMSGHPQFHQARGDLLMRQGRFQEAINEYNKLV